MPSEDGQEERRADATPPTTTPQHDQDQDPQDESGLVELLPLEVADDEESDSLIWDDIDLMQTSFEETNLDRLFELDIDLASSNNSTASQAPEPTPAPIELLDALHSGELMVRRSGSDSAMPVGLHQTSIHDVSTRPKFTPPRSTPEVRPRSSQFARRALRESHATDAVNGMEGQFDLEPPSDAPTRPHMYSGGILNTETFRATGLWLTLLQTLNTCHTPHQLMIYQGQDTPVVHLMAGQGGVSVGIFVRSWLVLDPAHMDRNAEEAMHGMAFLSARELPNHLAELNHYAETQSTEARTAHVLRGLLKAIEALLVEDKPVTTQLKPLEADTLDPSLLVSIDHIIRAASHRAYPPEDSFVHEFIAALDREASAIAIFVQPEGTNAPLMTLSRITSDVTTLNLESMQVFWRCVCDAEHLNTAISDGQRQLVVLGFGDYSWCVLRDHDCIVVLRIESYRLGWVMVLSKI